MKGRKKTPLPKKSQSEQLFLTIKAYCGVKRADGHSNIKLEIDLSPPFEMLDTSLDNQGAAGFKDQSAPAYFDIDNLEKLFTYINKVLPLAILKIVNKSAKENKKKLHAYLGMDKNKESDAFSKLFEGTGEKFVARLNQAIWDSKTNHPAAGEKGDIVSDFKTHRKQINTALLKLKINRIFVDPSDNSIVLNTATKSGGDVPPPRYPPG